MFRQLKNIDSAFRHVKLFTIFIICACITLCGYTIYTSTKEIADMQGKIYILYNGKLLQAMASDRKENLPVELKDHINTFHYWFFDLDPDEKENNGHLTKALYLADGSAKDIYENLKENSFYNNIISGNISQRIETDSITLDINQNPYYFRYSGKVTITRPTSVVIRNLVTQGYIRTVEQSDNNPHGFLIEKWQITDNRDLTVKQR